MTDPNNQLDDSPNDSLDNWDGPSKSQLKRDQNAIQDLIGELIALPKNQIEALAVEGQSFEEIRVAANMTPSSARNRQIRYITKLVGKDPDVIERIKLLLEKTEQAKRQNANQLHQAEYWRGKILAGTDEDIFEFSSQFGGSDQQKLRQLRRDFLKFSRTEKLSSKQLKSAEVKQKEISRKVFKLVSETTLNFLADQEES